VTNRRGERRGAGVARSRSFHSSERCRERAQRVPEAEHRSTSRDDGRGYSNRGGADQQCQDEDHQGPQDGEGIDRGSAEERWCQESQDSLPYQLESSVRRRGGDRGGWHGTQDEHYKGPGASSIVINICWDQCTAEGRWGGTGLVHSRGMKHSRGPLGLDQP
jgi:hypothetical protein